MKKLLVLLLTGLLLISATGCSSETETPEATVTPNSTQTPSTETTEVYKTGLGIVTSAKETEKTEENGATVQINSTLVAATFDSEGKIVAVDIDTSQQTAKLDLENNLTNEIDTISKVEKGADYGMAPASPIGKEYFEQIDALEDYMIGKTVEEVKAMGLEDGYPTDADVVSSVTIAVSSHIAALELAYENAKEATAVPATTGLGEVMRQRVTEATEEKGPNLVFYTDTVAASFDEEGRIVAVSVNVAMQTASYDVDGVATAELDFRTKREKGDEYGLAAVSGIEKEFYEQADFYESYVLGKTVEEVLAMPLDEAGKPTDADVLASCTIMLSTYNEALKEAYESSLK